MTELVITENHWVLYTLTVAFIFGAAVFFLGWFIRSTIRFVRVFPNLRMSHLGGAPEFRRSTRVVRRWTLPLLIVHLGILLSLGLAGLWAMGILIRSGFISIGHDGDRLQLRYYWSFLDTRIPKSRIERIDINKDPRASRGKELYLEVRTTDGRAYRSATADVSESDRLRREHKWFVQAALAPRGPTE